MNEVLINPAAPLRPMNERGQLSESSHLSTMRAHRSTYRGSEKPC
jgi:hypothetical protein